MNQKETGKDDLQVRHSSPLDWSVHTYNVETTHAHTLQGFGLESFKA